MYTSELLATQIIDAYSQWVQERSHDGFDTFLLTFMFKPSCHINLMRDEIDRVYSTFITRIVRRPNSSLGKSKRPILVACPDQYCQKLDKKLPPEAMAIMEFNGGVHYHGILLVPGTHRLKQGVQAHFATSKELYLKNKLLRLDVRPIDNNLSFVVEYALKGHKKGVASTDDIQIFPKSVGECVADSRVFPLATFSSPGVPPGASLNTSRRHPETQPRPLHFDA